MPGSGSSNLSRSTRAAASRQKLARFPALRDHVDGGVHVSWPVAAKIRRSGIRTSQPCPAQADATHPGKSWRAYRDPGPEAHVHARPDELEDHGLVALQRNRSIGWQECSPLHRVLPREHLSIPTMVRRTKR
jgi:hypothetical protein